MRRTGYKFLRRMAALGTAIFSGIGKRAYFLFAALGAMWREPRTYFPLIFRFMRSIGVDSFVLIAIVAAFIGSVIALQTRYQLFPGVQLSVVGLIVRQSIVLELGPLLTGLVLTGRVGARMTAEIGTMRVTEQIDALESRWVLDSTDWRHLGAMPKALCGLSPSTGRARSHRRPVSLTRPGRPRRVTSTGQARKQANW
jgi:ABC-type transporter Mla maintaining outer membrane lipid asymmetry permease subunit MlaE